MNTTTEPPCFIVTFPLWFCVNFDKQSLIGELLEEGRSLPLFTSQGAANQYLGELIWVEPTDTLPIGLDDCLKLAEDLLQTGIGYVTINEPDNPQSRHGIEMCLFIASLKENP